MYEKILQDTATKILNSDELRKPLLTSMGNTFAYAWEGTFSFIETWAAKKKIKQKYDIQAYKKEIEIKYNSIPSNKLVEPKLEIIGPALEASKYYIENETLRNMFSNLITSSFNSDTSNCTHPAFVEFIKQLNPLDATVFKELYVNKSNYPVAEVRLDYGNNRYQPLYRNFFPLTIFNSSNLIEVQAAIDNLLRLGLINIRNDKPSDDSKFDQIYNHEVYEGIKQHCSNCKIYIDKMNWNITMLGENFAKTCI